MHANIPYMEHMGLVRFARPTKRKKVLTYFEHVLSGGPAVLFLQRPILGRFPKKNEKPSIYSYSVGLI